MLTVFSEMNRRPAIWRLVDPSARTASTSTFPGGQIAGCRSRRCGAGGGGRGQLEMRSAGEAFDAATHRIRPEPDRRLVRSKQLPFGLRSSACGEQRLGQTPPRRRFRVRHGQPLPRVGRPLPILDRRGPSEAAELGLCRTGRGPDLALRPHRPLRLAGQGLHAIEKLVRLGLPGARPVAPSARGHLLSVSRDPDAGQAQAGQHLVIAGVLDLGDSLDDRGPGLVELAVPAGKLSEPVEDDAVQPPVPQPHGEALRRTKPLCSVMEPTAPYVERAPHHIQSDGLDAAGVTGRDRLGQAVSVVPLPELDQAAGGDDSSNPP